MTTPPDERPRRLARAIARRDFAAAADLLRPRRRAGGGGRPNAGRGARPTGQTLGESCPGAEAGTGPATHWLVRTPLSHLGPGAGELARRYAAVLRGAGQRFDELNASAGLCAAASAGPEDVLLLRLETCPLPPDGRRGIVLAGMLLWRGGELVVLQHLARRAEEETGVLSACLDALAGAAVAAVFGGGKSDVTILRRRSAEREIEAWGAFPHVLDLRREARRQWRGTLSDFRLPTLERALLGARRHGMDRGARAAACGRFIETGDARPIRDVLRNNALDLRAMAELVCLLLTGQDPTAT